MASDTKQQYLRQLREFLGEKIHPAPNAKPDIIVSRHEVEEVARSVGFDEEEAWRIFTRLKGHAWQGQYMAESRSEERGYTAARLTWVDHAPRRGP